MRINMTDINTHAYTCTRIHTDHQKEPGSCMARNEHQNDRHTYIHIHIHTYTYTSLHKNTYAYTQIIKKNLDPAWHEIRIKMTDICNGDVDSEFYIECWDWDRNTKNDFIGCVQTSVRKLFQVCMYVYVCVCMHVFIYVCILQKCVCIRGCVHI